MTTTDEMSHALASLEAQLQQDSTLLRELQQAANDCDPRLQIPVSQEDIETLESLPRPSPAPTRRAPPMLWASLRG